MNGHGIIGSIGCMADVHVVDLHDPDHMTAVVARVGADDPMPVMMVTNDSKYARDVIHATLSDPRTEDMDIEVSHRRVRLSEDAVVYEWTLTLKGAE